MKRNFTIKKSFLKLFQQLFYTGVFALGLGLFFTNSANGQIVINAGNSHFEDFEAQATCGTFCGAACPLTPGTWRNLVAEAASHQDWTVDIGPAGSSGSTGPNVDHTLGTNQGKYVYTETSGCNNRTAILESQDYDISGATCPKISYWYHMVGATMGSLFVEISTDGGTTWSLIDSKVGAQQNAENDPWLNQEVFLSPHIPAGVTTIRLRFRALTGTSSTSDMALDDILVADDAGAPPAFANCPTTPVQGSLASGCSGAVNYTVPTGSHPCFASTVSLVSGIGNGGSATSGIYTEVYQVTATNGLSSSCSFTLIVDDGQAPSITCPPSVTVNGLQNSCDAVVNYAAPVATDNCPGVSVSQTMGDPSGSSFHRGVHQQTFLATDASGLTADCSFNITVNVNDITPPSLTCPPDQTIGTVSNDPFNSGVGDGTQAPSSFLNQIAFRVTNNNTGGAINIKSVSVFLDPNETGPVHVYYLFGPPPVGSFSINGAGFTRATPLAGVTVTGQGTAAPVEIPFAAPVTLFNFAPINQMTIVVRSSNFAFDLRYAFNSPKTTTSHGVTVDGGPRRGTSATAETSNLTFTNRDFVGLVNFDLPTACFGIGTIPLPNSDDNCDGPFASVNAQSNVQAFTCTGASADPFSLSIVSTLPPAAGNINLSFFARGDVDFPAFNEFVDVFDENNVFLGRTTAGTQCAGYTQLNLSIPAATFNAWAVDGVVTLNCVPGSGVNCFCAAEDAFFTIAYDIGATLVNDRNGMIDASGQYPFGTTPVTYTATDQSGNTSQCTFNVEVEDTTEPRFDCPASATISSDPGQCVAAFGGYVPPVGNDNCGGTTETQLTGLGPGAAVYPVGATTERWQSVDDAGNTAFCELTITVVPPNPNPRITCPPSQTIANNDAGVCGAVANYSTPLTTDNCPGWILTQTEGLPSGSSFPVGVTNNQFRVEDGGTSTARFCNFTITVFDTELPTVTCPANIVQNMSATGTGNCMAAVTAVPLFADNCNTTPVSITSAVTNYNFAGISMAPTPISVTATRPATSPVTVTLSFQGDHNSTIELFEVLDENNISVFTIPVSSQNNGGCSIPADVIMFTISAADFNNFIADNLFTITLNPTSTGINSGFCDRASFNISYLSGPLAVNSYNGGEDASDIYPLGTTPVTVTVTDNAGNSTDCSFTITVVDDVAPTITCPGFLTTRPATAQFDYTGGSTPIPAVGTGGGGPGTETMAVVNVPVSGQILDVNVLNLQGTHSWVSDLTFDLISPNGTSVTIIDQICAGNNSDFNINIDDQAPLGSPPCPPTNGGTFRPQGAGSQALAGFNGENANGNWTLQIADAFNFDSGNLEDFTIEITYLEPVQIESNLTQVVDPGTCQAIFTYLTAIGDDNCSTNIITPLGTNIPSGGSFPLGSTNVGYTQVDAFGNTNSCSITVTITDNEAPRLTCPADLTVGTDNEVCHADMNPPLPTIDDCTTTTNIVLAPIPSGRYPEGNTNVIWSITDQAGNNSTCNFNIQVEDDEAPRLVCTPFVFEIAPVGQCQDIVTYVAVTATDNCNPVTPIQVSGSGSGATYPVGIHMEIYSATDLSGNVGTCAIQIQVIDAELPTITCPSSFTVPSDANCMGNVNYAMPTGNDNCPNPTISLISGSGTGPNLVTGSTTDTWRITDASGNINNCSLTVTVIDVIPPTIVCPADINTTTSANNAGDCDALVNYVPPVGADNCPNPTTTLIAGMGPGANYPPGVNVETYQVVDQGGNAVNCSFNIIVVDDEIPGITCQMPVSTTVGPGIAGLNIPITPAMVSDNCPLTVTETHNGALATGNFFPVGVTTVCFTAQDNDNTVQCCFDVEIIDVSVPLITCPPDLTVNISAGQCSAALTMLPPTVNRFGLILVNSFSGNGVAQGSFASGNTNISYTVTDVNFGATASCDFNLFVYEPVPPVIQVCPSDITLNVDANRCDKRVIYHTQFTDNCPGVRNVTQWPSFSLFPIGTTNVINNITDAAGNVVVCSFNVTIVDNIDPELNGCPGNIVTNNRAGQCGQNVVWTPPTTDDNCATNQLNVMSTANPNDFFAVGTTAVLYTLTDQGGNVTTCGFNITVNDTENPTINCPANIVVGNDSDNCDAVVNFVVPVGQDNCPGSLTVQTMGAGSGATYAVGGPYTQSFMVTDASGLQANCSFTITVNDTQQPGVTCPSNINVTTTVGQCTSSVNYSAAAFTDNCGGAVSSQNIGLASGSLFPVGTNQVGFTITDASGNQTVCTFDVTIQDLEPPVVVCPPDFTFSLAANAPVPMAACHTASCGAVVTIPSPVFSDNCPAHQISNDLNAGGANASQFLPVGTTTIVYTVIDASGNVSTDEINVTIIDDIPPCITCPSSIIVNNDFRACTANVNYAAPGSNDNCPGSVQSLTAGLGSGSAFPVGVTMETHQVMDASGNVADCSFTVTVIDNEAPEINCPRSETVNTDPGLCSAVATFGATVRTDNCPGVGGGQIAGLASGSTFPLGETTNTMQVVDATGATADCTFFITVVDNEPVSFPCPASQTIVLAAGSCEHVYTEPAVTDNCLAFNQIIINASHRTGDIFTPGTTRVCFDAAEDSSIFQGSAGILITEVSQFNGSTNGGTNPLPPGMSGDDLTELTNRTTNLTIDISGWQIERTGAGARSYNFPAGTVLNPGAVLLLHWGTGTDNPGINFYNSGGGSNNVGSGSACGYILSDAGGNIVDVTATNGFNVVGTGTPACPASEWTGTTGTSSGTGGIFRDCCDTNRGTDWRVSSSATPTNFGSANRNLQTIVAMSTQCCFEITIEDTQAPSITCPANINVNASTGECGVLVNYELPMVDDNCGGAANVDLSGPVTPYTFSGNIVNPVTLGISNLPIATGPVTLTINFRGDHGFGTTEIWEVFDENGNFLGNTGNSAGDCQVGYAQSSFIIPAATFNGWAANNLVNITLDPPPTNGINSFCVNNDAFISVAYVGQLTATLTSGLGRGVMFPVGTSNEVYTVTDPGGNEASCSFSVTVNDTENPTCLQLLPPAVNSITTTVNNSNNVIIPTTGGAVVESIVNIPQSGTVTDVNVLDLFGSHSWVGDLEIRLISPAGTQVLLLDNRSGNSDNFAFNFDDSGPFAIAGVAANTNTSSAVGNPAWLNFPTPPMPFWPAYRPEQPLAAFNGENVQGNWTLRITDVATGDGGTLMNFDLEVTFAPDPIPQPPADLVVNLENTTACSAIVSYGTMIGLDNCPGAVIAQTNGLPSGSSFPVGISNEDFLVTDASGNTANCGFTINVRDRVPPSINCPASMVVPNDPGQCSAVVNFSVTGSDNCPGWNINQIQGLASGSVFPEGTTLQQYQIMDAAGNFQNCTFSVEVDDREVPQPICNNFIVVLDPFSRPTSTVIDPSNLFGGGTDNCDPGVNLIPVSLSQSFFSCIDSGLNVVQLTVRDQAGNLGVCSAIVDIRGCLNALPVEILSFTGYNNNGKNYLNWTTVSEINSDFFVVEKSLDGVNFFEIGQVKAAGNSNEALNYQLIDNKPNQGANYYRLRIVDLDGSFEYSNMILIGIQHVFEISNLIPNPTLGELDVIFSSDFEGKLNYKLYNMAGQLVANQQVSATKGSNTLHLDLSKYARGVYHIVLENNNRQIHKRVVKQ